MVFINTMQITRSIDIDKAGRIVLPKPIRDQFQLETGSSLSLHVESNKIILEPESESSALIDRNGLLVHNGKAAEDLTGAVERSRRERDLVVGSWS